MKIKKQNGQKLILVSFFREIMMDKSTANITVRKRGFFGFIFRKQVIPFSSVKSVVIDCKHISPLISSGSQSTVSSSSDVYKIFLKTDSKKIEVDKTGNIILGGPLFGGLKKEEDIRHIASEISKFVGTEVEDDPEQYDSFRYDSSSKPVSKLFGADDPPRGWKL